MGMAPARVPLPLDFTDYGPIYVNPKQYHGILRRRQSRAKLEAQNKLVKARKVCMSFCCIWFLVEVYVLVLGKSVWSLLRIFNELIICLGKKEQIKITPTSLEVSQNETVQNDIFLRVCINTTKKCALPQWLPEGYSIFFFNNKYSYLFTNVKGNVISSITSTGGGCHLLYSLVSCIGSSVVFIQTWRVGESIVLSIYWSASLSIKCSHIFTSLGIVMH